MEVCNIGMTLRARKLAVGLRKVKLISVFARNEKTAAICHHVDGDDSEGRGAHVGNGEEWSSYKVILN